jgi:DNA-binding transcriptional LysR family regulator
MLQYYEYFYQVALMGNITKAANELFLTQPALSKAISNLESELNCKLFERTNKGVSLTLEGELLFQNVKRTFAQLNDTRTKIESLQKSKSTLIRIGAGRDIFLTYLLKRITDFSRLHTDVSFRFSIEDTNTIEQYLMNNVLDIGITTQPLNKKLIFQRTLFPLSDCFIVGKRYQHLTNETRTIFQLANYPLIMLSKKSVSRQHADRIFAGYGLVATPLHEMEDTSLISFMVQRDFGIGFVTENYVTDEIKNGFVYKVPIIEKFPERMATLTWTENTEFTSATKNLIDFLY